ncbi:MAG: glycosyltransferase family 2 protein [Planctomycetes bacterium]|nr:glycosyltransferase family 2 protein [Planctomycetota bacterium]
MNTAVQGISICIPTYRMAGPLRELLDSMLPRLHADIEVCISDNCSDDDTEQVVAEFLPKIPTLRYQRLPSNSGFDANVFSAIAMASKQWCWLLSSDDWMTPEGLEAVESHIMASAPDCSVILGNRKNIYIDMPEMPQGVLPEDCFPAYADGATIRARDLPTYFRASPTLNAAFGYLSSIVVRKQDWDGCAFGFAPFDGTRYAYTAKLMKTIIDGGALRICKSHIVVQRFLRVPSERYLDRLMIDFDGYRRLGQELIPDAESRRALWSILTRQGDHVLVLMKRLSSRQQWPRVEATLRAVGISRMRIFRASVWALLEPVVERYYVCKHRLKQLLRYES